jgi:uncharacterized surface protein with fasciclin (FAS1) repeats
MRNTKLKTYNRVAVVAGLAMALGPLSALSIASQYQGESSAPPVAAPAAVPAQDAGNRLARYDNKRGAGADAKGRRLADIAKGGVAAAPFAAALQRSDLSELLGGEGPYTLFVPVDGDLSSLPGNAESARARLEAHIVPGRVWTTDLMAETPLKTLKGTTIQPRVRGDIQINGATVLATDVAENGVVHFVSRSI